MISANAPGKGLEIIGFAICTLSQAMLEPRGPRHNARYALIVQRRMLHYVHMLDMPAASIESFARLPNDA